MLIVGVSLGVGGGCWSRQRCSVLPSGLRFLTRKSFTSDGMEGEERSALSRNLPREPILEPDAEMEPLPTGTNNTIVLRDEHRLKRSGYCHLCFAVVNVLIQTRVAVQSELFTCVFHAKHSSTKAGFSLGEVGGGGLIERRRL